MIKDAARDRKPVPNRQQYGFNIGHIGQSRAAFMKAFYVYQNMVIAIDNTTDTRPLTLERELDLATIADAFPPETMVDVEFRGTPDSYTIEIARNGNRYLIEGAGQSAELTGVVGDGDPAKPETVPDWLAAVLERTCDVREVSVCR